VILIIIFGYSAPIICAVANKREEEEPSLDSYIINNS
jgi:hypothetical protein